MYKSPNKPEREKKKEKKLKKDKFSYEPRHNVAVIPKTKNQKALVHAFYNNDLLIVRGVAGSGKTYLSLSLACKELDLGRFNQIVLCRPNIAVHKSIGFFPGTIEEKLQPWLAQQLAYISDFVYPNVLDLWIKNNKIMMVPLETIRGRSFQNTCLICDESQNLTAEEIKSIVTRLGENSICILSGDGDQSDLKDGAFNQFAELLSKHQIERTAVITMTIEDCLRSELCKNLLKLFHKEQY